jgi:hypothetical protein
MQTVPQILRAAGIRYQDYPQAPNQGVFLTASNQLMGTYRSLTRFRTGRPAYMGWDAHHIVEARDLDRLGIAHHFPVYEEQICVLIPEAAHAGRINSILNRMNPPSMIVNANFLMQAYRDAYSVIGNYCGSVERAIRDELVAIATAVFRAAHV